MKLPRHSTVVSYLALFVALGGSAYAVSKIDSADVRNRSIQGNDVADDALGGRQIDEGKLSLPLAAGDELLGAATCDPTLGAPVDCVANSIKLRQPGELLVITTGNAITGDSPGRGLCEIAVDGSLSATEFLGSDSPVPDNAFALTRVTEQLDRGKHTAALRCTETSGDLSIGNPTIAILAVDSSPVG